MLKLLVFCFLYAIISVAGAQNRADSVRMDSVDSRLARLVLADSAYLSEVDISVGKMPLGEVMRNIARVNGVNLCVKCEDDRMITCNFKRVKVIDLLRYLCREYGLDADVTGNIVSLSVPVPAVKPPREPQVSFDPVSRKLAYDLQDDNLVAVVRKIAGLTGINIVVPQALYQRQISGFSRGIAIDEAIPVLMTANRLETERGKSGIWTLFVPETVNGQAQGGAPFQPRRNFSADRILVDSLGKITVSVNRGTIQDIVSELCEVMRINRVFLTALDRQATIYVRNIGFDTFLNVLFAGTPYSYLKEGDIYLFGGAEQQKVLTTTAIVPMRYCAVEQIMELIPEFMKTGTQIKVFPGQNSVIVSGSRQQVESVRGFLDSVDRSVPLVTIEVMIVDVKKSMIREAGLTAGLGEKPVVTGGSLSPGINMSLSAASVNKLINSFNGFGTVNLGKVTPNFYLTLKALEEAGKIELRSTPKLSTLNGHEATLKSGEMKYYKEVQNNIIGTQNPIQSEGYTWKSVEANLSLKIIPYVGRDGKITLNVEIEQSEFMPREEKNAPPGTATRSFKSQIRVNNEEMVLLGGIDRNSREKMSAGLPFIARIPVLKWLFGTVKDNKVEEKLNVFIKPTVIF